jgi:hypothetical protein
VRYLIHVFLVIILLILFNISYELTQINFNLTINNDRLTDIDAALVPATQASINYLSKSKNSEMGNIDANSPLKDIGIIQQKE